MEQAYISQQQASGNRRVHFLNLERVFGPYAKLPAAQKRAWFHDGLHLTPTGACALGDGMRAKVRDLVDWAGVV